MKCENYIKSCFCLPRLPSPASLQFTKQIVMQSEKTNGQVFHHNCRGKVIFNWHVTNALLDSVMKQNRQYDLFILMTTQWDYFSPGEKCQTEPCNIYAYFGIQVFDRNASLMALDMNTGRKWSLLPRLAKQISALRIFTSISWQ